MAPEPEATLHYRGGYRREDFEDFNRASASADDQVSPMNDELAELALDRSARTEGLSCRPSV